MAEVLDYSNVRGGSGGITVAKPSRDYRWRRYALVIVILGWGIWSINDGFYRYPRENKAFLDDPKHKGVIYTPHPGLDVPLNQWLGVIMPPLSLLFLAWVFYNSRGMYKFDGQTLEVPGHPPVPVKSIVKIDRSKWDRKGIAYLYYQVAGSAALGKIRLDDFIYDRVPTDAIFKRLEAQFEAGKSVPVTPAVSR